MTDLVTFGETMLRLSPPEGTRLETAETLAADVGGAESNVAVAASALGLEATWLSKLPASPLGRRIARELRSHGVTTGVAWDEGDDARLGTYYVEPGGEPRGTDVVYDRAGASITTVSVEELPTDAIDDCRYFHTTGITPALSDAAADATAALLREARDRGATTVFDVNYRSKLWSPADARAGIERLFPDVDVLVVARRDAETVLGREGDTDEIARALATEHDFRTVVVTRGERGALARHDGERYEQPVYEAETVDPIGTGDAFVGGFLARRARGGDVAEALAWGGATAALKRTVAGDLAVVTPAEVERVVDAGRGDISR